MKKRTPEEEQKASVEALERQLLAARTLMQASKARDDFMTFIKFTMPDPANPNNPLASVYENAKHHDALAAALEQVEKGEYQILILTMPPRHGKSEQVSRRFPAWFMGKHPTWSTVVATYNDDFAMDFGAEVRRIMTSQRFRTVFPGVTLARGGAAKDRLQTDQGGMATFVGVGGSLTGRGAHCFPVGTPVLTTAGWLPIENLKDSPASVKAISYDRQTGQLRAQRIEAFANRKATRLLRVTTSSGRVVESTPDHPFLTERGYLRADQLSPGNRLLCAVPDKDTESRVRDHEARGPRSHGVFLRKPMLGGTPERKATWNTGQALHGVRSPSAARETLRNSEAAMLLSAMYDDAEAASAGRSPSQLAETTVFGVRKSVRSEPRANQIPREDRRPSDSVLRQDLRESSTLQADVRSEQPGLSARPVAREDAAARGQGVSGSSQRDTDPGFIDVRLVQRPSQDARTPHKSRSDGQPLGELGLPMLAVSPATSRERTVFVGVEEDCVLSVDECPVISGGVEVFDIQVAEDHNFFANGICVHNCLIVDDLIKDYEQARSQAFRDRAWDWFTKVAMTRRMGPKLVVITFTRWHTDDIIGRLTDPENEHYSRTLAEKIKIIDLPAIAGEDDPLGRAPGEPLWPDRYDLDFLEEQRSLDPLGFESLYQQRPSVADGILFRREHFRFYDPGMVDEKDLRIYCASDHAVTTDQRSDSTVLLRVGVDRQNHIYVLDCWWKKARTDEVVEAILTMGSQTPKPLMWWAEKGHISKSIGPFLRKRMVETNTFLNVVEVTPAGDKEQRAQSISARVAMGYVHFPKGKPWVEKAINELLAFPNGLHDDFVDAFAYIGLGLQSHIPVKRQTTADKPPKYGTLAWVKEEQKRSARASLLGEAGGF